MPLQYVTPEGLKLVTCKTLGGALEGWRAITGLGLTWIAAAAKVNGLGESGRTEFLPYLSLCSSCCGSSSLKNHPVHLVLQRIG